MIITEKVQNIQGYVKCVSDCHLFEQFAASIGGSDLVQCSIGPLSHSVEGGLSDSDREDVQSVIQSLVEKGLWLRLLLTNSPWQPDTRLVRYKGICKRYKDEFPPLQEANELVVSSEFGIRFVVVLEIEISAIEGAMNLLMDSEAGLSGGLVISREPVSPEDIYQHSFWPDGFSMNSRFSTEKLVFEQAIRAGNCIGLATGGSHGDPPELVLYAAEGLLSLT